MKSTLKLVFMFIGAVIGISAVAIAGFILIEKNKTFHIYDVRIVHPVSSPTYIYVDNTKEYTYMKNKTVYLTNPAENKFEIGVFAHTSNNTGNVEVTSSDESVATVTIDSRNRCFVNYFRAGEATITANVYGVTDTINLIVYDNTAEHFSVYDEAYYGESSYNFANKLVSYADNINYAYSYEVSDNYNGKVSENINNSLLKVDQSKVDKTIFQAAYIEPNSRKLVLKCREFLADENGETILDENGNPTKITETVDTTIVVQSFYKTDSGEEKLNKNFVVTVHIIADTPEYMQVLLATSPDFENGIVYTYTPDLQHVDITKTEDTDLIEQVLSNRKEIKYLGEGNETETYNVFYSEKVKTIYLRFRKVYTNGTIVYLNPETYEENPFVIKRYFEGETTGTELDVFGETEFNSNSRFRVATNKNYYMLTLDEEFFETNGKISLELILSDYYKLDSKKFEFEYRTLFVYEDESVEEVQAKVSDFYSYDEATGFYTYKYWDRRTRFYGEIYDLEGNIIDFVREAV